MRVRDPEVRVRSNTPGRLDGRRAEITRLAPYLGDRVGELDDWSDIKLLTLVVDRLQAWQFWAEATTSRAGEELSGLDTDPPRQYRLFFHRERPTPVRDRRHDRFRAL
jgi:hypothetical protein